MKYLWPDIEFRKAPFEGEWWGRMRFVVPQQRWHLEGWVRARRALAEAQAQAVRSRPDTSLT